MPVVSLPLSENNSNVLPPLQLRHRVKSISLEHSVCHGPHSGSSIRWPHLVRDLQITFLLRDVNPPLVSEVFTPLFTKVVQDATCHNNILNVLQLGIYPLEQNPPSAF